MLGLYNTPESRSGQYKEVDGTKKKKTQINFNVFINLLNILDILAPCVFIIFPFVAKVSANDT